MKIRIFFLALSALTAAGTVRAFTFENTPLFTAKIMERQYALAGELASPKYIYLLDNRIEITGGQRAGKFFEGEVIDVYQPTETFLHNERLIRICSKSKLKLKDGSISPLCRNLHLESKDDVKLMSLFFGHSYVGFIE